MTPTDAEIRDQLDQHGHRTDSGRWWFSAPGDTHTEEEALRIVEACMKLGTPITDLVTSEVWLSLVSQLADMKDRLGELEHKWRSREDYEDEMRDLNG